MYVSSRLRNHIIETKTRKGFTLNEVEQQNSVDIVLMLCYLSLNFEVLPLARISFATLSMHFVDWSSFANVKTIYRAHIH